MTCISSCLFPLVVATVEAGQPCDNADAVAYSKLLGDINIDLRELGNLRVSVDTGQSCISSTGSMNVTAADLYITMNTYADRPSFDIALPRDFKRVGQARFGLGVCPDCTTPKTEEEIIYRMDQATKFDVCSIGYWAGLEMNNVTATWWREIRKWKAA
jgi:hypothetical protein